MKQGTMIFLLALPIGMGLWATQRTLDILRTDMARLTTTAGIEMAEREAVDQRLTAAVRACEDGQASLVDQMDRIEARQTALRGRRR